MQVVAQSWLAPQLTGAGTLLSLLAAAQFLPCCCWDLMAAWSPTARASRRLLGTQSALGLLALVLGLLTVTHVVRLWMVFVLAVALGTLNSVDQPTRQTFVPEMVGRVRLQNAVSLNGVLTNVARAIGRDGRRPGPDRQMTAAVISGWCALPPLTGWPPLAGAAASAAAAR